MQEEWSMFADSWLGKAQQIPLK